MDLFSKKSISVSEKIYFCSGSYSLRPVAMQMAASKRFHKFWFLVLENPGFGWDFLVIGLARSALVGGEGDGQSLLMEQIGWP